MKERGQQRFLHCIRLKWERRVRREREQYRLAAVQVDQNCLVTKEVRRKQSNSYRLTNRFVVQFLKNVSRLLHGLPLCVCVSVLYLL